MLLRKKKAQTKKRSSMSTKSQSHVEDQGSRSSFENPPPTKKRSSASVNPQPPSMLIDDPEPRSSFEAVPAPPNWNHNQPQEIKSRPASVSPQLHSYLQAQAQVYPPHLASRPSPSSTFTSTSSRPISSSHAYVTTTPGPNSSSAATTVKRKKSRPYVDPDDYGESDGTQADAEFGGSGLTNGWVNVDGRRKSVLHSHGGAGGSRERKLDGNEERRHSMAV